MYVLLPSMLPEGYRDAVRSLVPSPLRGGCQPRWHRELEGPGLPGVPPNRLTKLQITLLRQRPPLLADCIHFPVHTPFSAGRTWNRGIKVPVVAAPLPLRWAPNRHPSASS